jgi:hypothetical protein
MFPGLSPGSSAARVAVISPSRRITSSSATRSGCASARIARASVITRRRGRLGAALRLDRRGVVMRLGRARRDSSLAHAQVGSWRFWQGESETEIDEQPACAEDSADSSGSLACVATAARRDQRLGSIW